MNFKKFLPWIIIGIVVLWFASLYNGLVGLQEPVEKSWSNVETQYQRRADLIDNLVATVQNAAEFEKSTIESVIQARASATQIKVDPKDLTPEKLQEFQQAQGQLSVALGRLLAVSERYPELKSVALFSELQAQIEGTENRIQVARREFNDVAAQYNTVRRKFPRNIVAGIFGFEAKPYFEADKGAEKAPSVRDSFDKK